MSRTRSEHIAWCQMRALGYVDDNMPKEAVMSMMSDVRKHPDTDTHIGITLGLGYFNSTDLVEIRKWIEGFN